MQCDACGASVAPGARFCSNCGHLLSRAEERRIVTVVFADVVGFTAIAESADPENVKHLVDRCFQRLVGDITAFGGSVDKIVGDGIVALFGAPVAHEDDAERAVRAALRMQRTVADLSNELGLSIRLRIGVNTGEVLVGALRGGGDYTAMGDTVNLASRLESATAPGEVLVGPVTHTVTSEVIRYEPRGTMAVKGRVGAVEVHAAVEELTLPGRRPRRVRTPLVGRDPELNLLCGAIDSAVGRRQAHLLLVVGEAGMGKSRLAEELWLRSEATHGAAVVEGRCLPYGETSPFWPLWEGIRQLAHVKVGDPVDLVERRVLAMVEETVGEPGAVSEQVAAALLSMAGNDAADPDGHRAREDTFAELLVFLRALLATRPVIIAVSDVHWADRALLDLAEQLLTELRSEPFVIVATSRWQTDDERWIVPPGRHDTLVLNLTPLDASASARLATALLGTDISEDLARQLHARSGGNPFFLEELTSLLSDNAALPAVARAGEVDETQLPDTLRGLVSARLDALTRSERSMVDDASVLGRDGPVYALLLMASERGEDGPEKVFARLVAKDIFTTDGDGWRFRSDLVREVAYSTLTKSSRAKRHSEIALWMDANADKRTNDLRTASRLAYHYTYAIRLSRELGGIEGLPVDLIDRALIALERFADQAARTDSSFAARRANDRMLEVAPLDDDARRTTAFLGRAAAELELRDLRAAEADVEEALGLARRAGDEADEARALTLGAEVALARSEVETARATIEDALTIWRRLEAPRGLADALRQSGLIHRREGAAEEAVRSFKDALAIYRRVDDRSGEAWCLQSLAWSAFERGEIQHAEEHLAASIQLFRETGDSAGLGWAQGLMAYVRFYLGHRDEAEELALVVERESGRRGDKWGHGMMSVLLASTALWSGRCREAVDRAEAATARFEAIEDAFGSVQSLSVLARALMACGRVAEAWHRHEEAAATALSMPDNPLERLVTVAALGSATHAGDLEAGAMWLDRASLTAEPPGELGAPDIVANVSLARMQAGLPALEEVRRAADAIRDDQPAQALDAVLALAAAVEDEPELAVAIAESVIDDDLATFLDRVYALLGCALAQTHRGDVEATRASLSRASAVADASDSIVTRLVVELADAVIASAWADPSALDRRLDVDRRLGEAGIDAQGWANLFESAVSGTGSVAVG